MSLNDPPIDIDHPSVTRPKPQPKQQKEDDPKQSYDYLVTYCNVLLSDKKKLQKKLDLYKYKINTFERENDRLSEVEERSIQMFEEYQTDSKKIQELEFQVTKLQAHVEMLQDEKLALKMSINEMDVKNLVNERNFLRSEYRQVYKRLYGTLNGIKEYQKVYDEK